ncbi:DivIVA domain-containing protein [Kocuria sp.]|uniref:DivIVA domain-containing protein n=1 Tax=Kocuria sp. TaxID=1871328 RepID=UPI0026DAE910|nr:DivIVA domain-containing protein [Kocuria sp.]MDO4919579.1 DivIVA domain-containing protein [Kocuria sp.]
MTAQDRFPRLPERGWGYDPAQVDDFLDRVGAVMAATGPVSPPEDATGPSSPSDDAAAPVSGDGTVRHVGSRQVRERVFDRARQGYDPAAVDAHLDELEDELFARECRAFVAEHGVQRWNEHVELLGQQLLGRLNRPRTQRFRRPEKHRTVGYSVADVDVLCDSLMEHLRASPDVDPRLLRDAVFRPAQGQRCYEEQQVDAFLDRAVEFVLAVRTENRRRA